ncbi:hypothetical protein LINGRAHAP2_LOCUS29382, partial [Linum grandiflorum]
SFVETPNPPQIWPPQRGNAAGADYSDVVAGSWLLSSSPKLKTLACLSQPNMLVQNQLRAFAHQLKLSNRSYEDSVWKINQKLVPRLETRWRLDLDLVGRSIQSVRKGTRIGGRDCQEWHNQESVRDSERVQ